LNSQNWSADGNEASFLALPKARTSSKYPLLFTNYNPETNLSTSSQPYHPNGVNPPSGVIALNSAGPSKSTLSFSPSSKNFLKCSVVRWASTDALSLNLFLKSDNEVYRKDIILHQRHNDLLWAISLPRIEFTNLGHQDSRLIRFNELRLCDEFFNNLILLAEL
jgi:hypothetical protein